MTGDGVRREDSQVGRVGEQRLEAGRPLGGIAVIEDDAAGRVAPHQTGVAPDLGHDQGQAEAHRFENRLTHPLGVTGVEKQVTGGQPRADV